MRRRLLEWGLLAAFVMPQGVSVQRVPKGVSLDATIHAVGKGHRFEKTTPAKFRGYTSRRWKRSYMMGFGGEGLGAFEWIHEEVVAVPRNHKKGGYYLYKFQTTSLDPVLQGAERAAWDRFLRGPARK